MSTLGGKMKTAIVTVFCLWASMHAQAGKDEFAKVIKATEEQRAEYKKQIDYYSDENLQKACGGNSECVADGQAIRKDLKEVVKEQDKALTDMNAAMDKLNQGGCGSKACNDISKGQIDERMGNLRNIDDRLAEVKKRSEKLSKDQRIASELRLDDLKKTADSTLKSDASSKAWLEQKRLGGNERGGLSGGPAIEQPTKIPRPEVDKIKASVDEINKGLTKRGGLNNEAASKLLKAADNISDPIVAAQMGNAIIAKKTATFAETELAKNAQSRAALQDQSNLDGQIGKDYGSLTPMVPPAASSSAPVAQTNRTNKNDSAENTRTQIIKTTETKIVETAGKPGADDKSKISSAKGTEKKTDSAISLAADGSKTTSDGKKEGPESGGIWKSIADAFGTSDARKTAIPKIDDPKNDASSKDKSLREALRKKLAAQEEQANGPKKEPANTESIAIAKPEDAVQANMKQVSAKDDSINIAHGELGKGALGDLNGANDAQVDRIVQNMEAAVGTRKIATAQEQISEQEARAIGAANSESLFERIKTYHSRCTKNNCVRLGQNI